PPQIRAPQVEADPPSEVAPAPARRTSSEQDPSTASRVPSPRSCHSCSSEADKCSLAGYAAAAFLYDSDNRWNSKALAKLKQIGRAAVPDLECQMTVLQQEADEDTRTRGNYDAIRAGIRGHTVAPDFSELEAAQEAVEAGHRLIRELQHGR